MPPADVGPPPRPSGADLDLLEKARPRPRSGSSGDRRALRVAIVTENFLPKIDGVTRTLAMLLEHLQAEGHEALVLGPSTPLTSYAGAEVVSTKGIPLLGVYRGLGLNFLRPRFIRKLREFDADVVLFADPIFLCAQTIPAIQFYFPDTPLLSSYHTNLAMYATLFGFPWLTPLMWALQRNLHGRCDFTYCPSLSTARMLGEHGIENVRLWPRGVDVDLFRPAARDYALRQSWGVEPPDLDCDRPSPRLLASEPRTSLSADELPPLALPPPYTAHPAAPAFGGTSPSKLAVLYVGRISWEKNLLLLIEAFRGLQEPDAATGRPACQLVFVGDGPARGEVESLCAEYGLGALFLGFRKGEELAAAYASADVFAFPSFTETFGQVVSEAQASGLPVVGLRAEGVSDLVEHGRTGLLLDLNDLISPSIPPTPPSYTRAMSSIPSNPHALLSPSSPTFPAAVALYRSLLVSISTSHSHRRAMGAAAHEVASKRSWWRAMEDLCDGFRELVTLKAQRKAEKGRVQLERTSTIELAVVCDSGDAEGALGKAAVMAEASGTAPKRKGLLGAMRRTGGRLRATSAALNPLQSWLVEEPVVAPAGGAGGAVAVKGGGRLLVVLVLEVVAFFALLSLAIAWSSRLKAFSFLRS
ncbi:hypothetical protein JCM10450v2_005600 [Rhodotorula kratochvilovae]